MFLTDSQQTAAFLWAFVFGVLIAAAYTVMVSIRASFGVHLPGIVITDTLFSFLVCAANFIYAIAFTDSAVRLYVIIAELTGFLLLYFLAGRYLKRFTVFLVRSISGIVQTVSNKIIFFIKSTLKIKHSNKNL